MGPILGELQELSHVWVMTNSSAKAPSPFLKFSYLPKPLRCRRQLRSFNRPSSTWGETWEGALDEIRALPAVQKLTRLFLCTTTTAHPGLAWLPNRMLLPDLESGRRSLHR